MRFLKVTNRIFELGLAANELKVYLYLTTCKNPLGVATVRIQTIQSNCAIASATTVRSALASLERRGLVHAKLRHGRDGYFVSSEYSIVTLGGKWFRLWFPKDALALDKSAFCVYLYLCQQKMSSGKACPSQSVIAAAVGLARRTVNDAIQRLVELGMILKAALWKGKHNLYSILFTRHLKPNSPDSYGRNKKELPPYQPQAASREQPKGSHKTILNIPHILDAVKRAFFNLTCAKNVGQYLDLTLTLKIKRIISAVTCLRSGPGRSVPIPQWPPGQKP